MAAKRASKAREAREDAEAFDYAGKAEYVRKAHTAFREAREMIRENNDPALRQVFEASGARLDQALEDAYPPGFREDFERLKAGDPAGLKTTVAFLEADPYFHGSGYAKQYLAQYIKRLPEIPAPYDERLRQVLLDSIDYRRGREHTYYCRIAPLIVTPEFVESIRERMDPRTHTLSRRLRARRVLSLIDPAWSGRIWGPV